MNHQHPIWHPAPARPILRAKEIHVWRGDLVHGPEPLSTLWFTLSADEKERARRFHFHRDRQRFIAARGLLRNILSRYVQTPPQDLSFAYEEQGKPVLASPTAQLFFNVSHSQDLALYAVTQNSLVGIDLEFTRTLINPLELAQSVFSEQEIAALRDLPPEQQTTAFFNCWTSKEAFIKALGAGLSHPLDSFTVSVGESAALIDLAGLPNEISRWSLIKLYPHPDYKAAVAVRDSSPHLLYWQWHL